MRIDVSSRAALFSLAFVLASGTAAAIPAFPGAQGFGAAASGGRGGQVIKVTTLAESGPGSLKEALATAGPRIIVFDVSGVIDLGAPNASDPFDESDGNNILLIEHGDVTIAGQTAPGGGITIRGRLYAAYDSDVGNIILRHVRIRPPAAGGSDGEQYDALRFSVNSRVIVDHVSVAFGVDENIDAYEAADFTLQWSTIEEPATEGHPENEHNYGILNDQGRVTVHHNLFVHSKNRNPALAGAQSESRNNVAYNVRHGFVHHNSAEGEFNIVGNHFLRGPDDQLIPFYFDGEPFSNASYHLKDNCIDDPPDKQGSVDNPWQDSYFGDLVADESLYSATEFVFSGTDYVPVTTESCTDALTSVLDKAGAFPRDVVTLRVIQETKDRSGSWGAHYPSDLFAGLSATTPPTDSDDDGMPDDWENAHGLDPNDASDSSQVMDSGYTAIEEYINGRADELVGGGGGSSGAGGTSGGGAGGSSGAGAGSGAGGSATGGSSGGSGASASGGGDDDGGCGCATPGSRAPGALSLLVAGLGALWLSRRRARRSEPRSH